MAELLGTTPAREELDAIAAAIDDLRAGLPGFRREAAALLAECADHE
ncbi:hypothetical protein [Microbacterium sp. SD291]|nr:hypothetical protein [Microbacterium sp. SD291]MBO0980096.1 hypothetical protein [Microbacterium sp. SD291]